VAWFQKKSSAVERALLRSRISLSAALGRFRNYCGPMKVARSGFPWEKTTKGDVASVYTNCETALVERSDVRLSSRKAACSLVAPQRSTENPGRGCFKEKPMIKVCIQVNHCHGDGIRCDG
jgi:hypothetical protein